MRAAKVNAPSRPASRESGRKIRRTRQGPGGNVSFLLAGKSISYKVLLQE